MTENIEQRNEANLLKDLRNSDEFLKEESPRVIAARKRLGLEGLVGGLQAVIINTELDRQKATAEELLRYTGLEYLRAFEDEKYKTCLLKTPHYSEFQLADFQIRSRIKGDNPFYHVNKHVHSIGRHLLILELTRMFNNR